MMPSSSKKQHNFMAAIAHSPSVAKKVGVPQSVGKDFNEADKGRKFSKGGDMKKMSMGGYADGGMTMVKKGDKMVPDFAADGIGKMAKGGMAKFEKSGKDIESKGMREGSKADMAMDKKQMMGMKKGGMAESDMKEEMAMDKKQDKAMIQKAFRQHDAQEHEGGKGTTLKLAKGGNARYMSFTEKGKPDGMKPVTKMSKGGMSKAEKQAREMIAEMKMQAAAKRAYDDADKTEPAMAAPSAPSMPSAPPMAPPPRPPMPQRPMPPQMPPSGGGMPGMNKGGSVSSASRRGDGIAQRGKTRGNMC
jgi:hypothetical protein